MNDIIAKIYDSPEYRLKGMQVQCKDCFIIRNKETWYVIFVIKISDFDYKNIKYQYSVYRVNTHKVLYAGTAEYKMIVSAFPNLNSLDYNGGRMDFLQMQIQKDLISNIVSSLDANETLNSSEITSYLEYLSTMNGMVSDSVKKLYNYFKEEI